MGYAGDIGNRRFSVPGVLNICSNTFHTDPDFDRECGELFEGYPPLEACIENR